jgi:hypothetical protein
MNGYAGMIGCSCGKKISSIEIRQHLEDEHSKIEE